MENGLSSEGPRIINSGTLIAVGDSDLAYYEDESAFDFDQVPFDYLYKKLY